MDANRRESLFGFAKMLQFIATLSFSFNDRLDLLIKSV